MPDNFTIVLFADISGSVALYERLGDETTKSIVVELQESLSKVVNSHGGVVHEVIGDEIMCRFEQAKHAVECAAKIHQSTADFASRTAGLLPDTLQMRIGIHSGSAIFEQDRLFGDTVNTAARIMSIAQAGQTITTGKVLEQLPRTLQEIAREFDKTTLKGKSEPVIVYDFPWQLQDLTQINEIAVDTATVSLQLSYREKTIALTAKECPAWLGRAMNNLVVVDSAHASRRHVAIEYTRGRFVLSDQSTNGTHVYPDSSEDIYLRREQMPIWGSGRFSLGAPQEDLHDHIVTYRTIR